MQELGLLGSTAYAELNAKVLGDKAIAYLNVDSAVSGPNFAARSASHRRVCGSGLRFRSGPVASSL